MPQATKQSPFPTILEKLETLLGQIRYIPVNLKYLRLRPTEDCGSHAILLIIW